MIKFLRVLLFLFCSNGLFAQTVFKDYVDGQVYVKLSSARLRAIVRYNPNNISAASLGDLSACLQRHGVTKISRPFYQAADDALLSSVLKFEFAQAASVTAFINALNKTSGVDYAEKVPLMKADVTPNDPVFPAHLTQINAPAAWNIFNGSSSVIVAIVDDAVMWSHADLSANIYTNAGEIAGNNIDDDNNGYVDDVHGYDVTDMDNNPAPTSTLMSHGTHCAGIAGARTDNAIGTAAIGWNIKILPVKCQTDNGSPSVIVSGYEGIIYSVRAKARVISCSWSGAAYALTSEAVINYAWARGCLVVAAAGNSSSSALNYPAAYNHVYSVASVSSGDVKSGFSNYGTWVDISAPGENIYSTVPYGGSAAPAYQTLSGTSMAAPMVAGLAGLMLSKSPQMTADDLANCISSSAVNIYTLSGNASYTTGSQLGAGRIDAFQAMTCAAAFGAHAPLADFLTEPLSACPNTAVHFTDSTLYLPTSWQWTFQGGSPATSTLANPVVQWATAGTYSVSLVTTNANGSSTKTKLLAVTTATSPVFSEGFEAGTFLPVGWHAKNIGNDVAYWQRKTGVGAYGSSTACAMFDNNTYNTGGDRDEMQTPKYNFTSVASASLNFDVAYARYDAINSDTLEVRLSTDCGVSWSSIYLKGGTALATAPDASNQFMPGISQWRTESINVSAYAGQGSVMFSFVNHGQYGQPIYLDNINLHYPAPVITLAIPDSVCAGQPVVFANNSSGAASYAWTLSGASPGSSAMLSPTVTYNAPGTYSVMLSATNGSAVATGSALVHVMALPSVSFVVSNASCGTCSDASIQAQPIAGSAPFLYSWVPGGGSAATASGLSPGCYSLNISAHGCAATATVCVSFETGIEALSIEKDGWSVYPNPATSNLFIAFNQPFTYSLFSGAGQLLLKNTSNNAAGIINLDIFANGIYFLELSGGKSSLRKKIMISR